MEITKLEGEDKKLYELVAHLAMNGEVLAYNLNYPYKTSEAHLWFVATDNDNVIGFIPVKREGGIAKVNNYYVVDDDHAVFAALLKEVINTLSVDFDIESITQVRHVPDFEQNGFAVMFYWKRYAKMRAFKKNEEERVRTDDAKNRGTVQ
ncbi:MAG: hypothetical protein LBV41_12725 [Cytophagaceae bacterium]|jgi:hypothetical protein|nr:hypothetical protein [Cytophagaceae bacterium]